MTITSDTERAIILDKEQGVSDIDIGRKYGITYSQLERIVRKSKGVSLNFIKAHKKITALYPKDFKEETTSVWSFKNRGNWATHSGEYRGNWSPYIPRNVILKYSKPGELVLDYFCGAGTTAVESKLLGRKCIAIDINDKAIELAKKNLDFSYHNLFFENIYEPTLLVGDARDLSFLGDNCVDLICAHPPYANIINYTEKEEADLSYLDIEVFLDEMQKVAKESYRVLKPRKKCAVLIGDMRRHKHIIPLGFKLIDVYLNAGFKLKELIIKRQHNCKTTGFWYSNSIKFNFLLLAHEYLPIFEKPLEAEYKVKEPLVDYSISKPLNQESFLISKLERLEATTVWISKTDDVEGFINGNVIDRYSDGENYKIINLGLKDANKHKRDYSLVFIKSIFADNNIQNKETIKNLKGLIDEEIRHIKPDGYLVIQTNDVRNDGYIMPWAKYFVDLLNSSNVSIKEIVIVTSETQKTIDSVRSDNLEITHQYLLIYKKI